jgi:hypothetical protein
MVPSRRQRGERDQKVLRVEFAAGTESPADIDLDQIDGAFRQTQHCGEQPPIEEGHLGCTMDRHSATRRNPFG